MGNILTKIKNLPFLIFIFPFVVLPFLIYYTLLHVRMLFLLPLVAITGGKNVFAKDWWHYTRTMSSPFEDDHELQRLPLYNKHIKTLNKQVRDHFVGEKWWVIYNYFDNKETALDFQEFRDTFHRVYTQSGLENIALAVVKHPGETESALYFIGTTADVIEVKDDHVLSEDYYNGYKIIDPKEKKPNAFNVNKLDIESFTFQYDIGEFQGYKTTRVPVTSIQTVRYLHPEEPLWLLANRIMKIDNGHDSPLIRQWRFESERYLTIKHYLEPLLDDVTIPSFIRDMMIDRIPYLETLDDDMATKLFEHEDYLFYFLRFADDLFFMPYIDEIRKIKEYDYIQGYLRDNQLYTQNEVIHRLKEDGHTDFIKTFVGDYVS